MQLKRSIKFGKVKIVFKILFISQIIFFNCFADTNNINEKFAELDILDKVSSKTSNLVVIIGKDYNFQNLIINVLKCHNSKFDDDPEVTAYMQVRDSKSINKDKVFIFNGWTFASSPSIRPFDHPVYDIWLKKCYN
tara:strand:- start:407 stop:814 length:408 start_codon:yes stop_codon:yes gene_type:complete